MARVRLLLVTIVGMSGLRLDRSALQVTIGAAGITGSYLVVDALVTTWSAAVSYVVLIWATYYIGHIVFYQFNANRLMKRWLGRQRGYRMYETVLGIVYFNQGWCQVKLLAFSEGSGDLPAATSLVLLVGGAGLFLAGSVTKIWATVLVGLDVYYYRDMFAERRGDCGLVTSGPYAIFTNPMYGVGMLTAYGGALDARSYEGLLCAAAFHLSIYVFYHSVERPFVKRMYTAAPESSAASAC